MRLRLFSFGALGMMLGTVGALAQETPQNPPEFVKFQKQCRELKSNVSYRLDFKDSEHVDIEVRFNVQPWAAMFRDVSYKKQSNGTGFILTASSAEYKGSFGKDCERRPPALDMDVHNPEEVPSITDTHAPRKRPIGTLKRSNAWSLHGHTHVPNCKEEAKKSDAAESLDIVCDAD